MSSSNQENPSTTLRRYGQDGPGGPLFPLPLQEPENAEIIDGPRLAYWRGKWLWLGGHGFPLVVPHRRRQAPAVLHGDDPSRGVRRSRVIDGIPRDRRSGRLHNRPLLLAAVGFSSRAGAFSPSCATSLWSARLLPLFLLFWEWRSSGVLMRHFTKMDDRGRKGARPWGWRVLPSPQVSRRGSARIFFIVHLLLLSTLLAYFPFSKLMHLRASCSARPGTWRTTAGWSGTANPWNHPVQVHTYEEYEDDFREKMKGAGIPVEKE